MAEASIALHRFKEALAFLEELQKVNPQDPGYLGLRGDVLLNMGDVAGARKSYAELKKVHDSYFYLTRDAGLKYVDGKTQDAIEAFKDALEEAPASIPAELAWCNVQIGGLYFSIGDFENAQKFYTDALDAQPNYFAALDRTAELKAARGEFDAAIALYTKLVERAPRADLFQALGEVYAAAAGLPTPRHGTPKRWKATPKPPPLETRITTTTSRDSTATSSPIRPKRSSGEERF